MHVSTTQVEAILRLGSPNFPRHHGDPEGCEYEAENPMKASTASFDEALNDTMPDEVHCDVEMVKRAAC
jgi:hypothetical protein